MNHWNDFNDNYYKKLDISVIKWYFDAEIKYFKTYFAFNNKNLLNIEIEYSKYKNEDITIAPEYAETINKIYTKDIYKFQNYYYCSSIVALYSLLENNLTKIAEKIKTETELYGILENFSKDRKSTRLNSSH